MTDTSPSDRDLAIRCVPARVRPALATLLAVDRRLADIVRTTREPLVGQMRLTWWHDALARLDGCAAPAEPLLQAVQRDLLAHGVTGADLATMIAGWEVLLDPLDAAAVATHGMERGARLFAIAGQMLPGDADQLRAAGEGWALADLATHLTRADIASLAKDAATALFSQAFAKSWPRSARPIGSLAFLSRLSLQEEASARALLRFTRFRLIGR